MRGVNLYVELLSLLRQDTTLNDIADQVSMTKQALRRTLWAMVDRGLLSCVGWKSEGRGPLVPVFRYDMRGAIVRYGAMSSLERARRVPVCTELLAFLASISALEEGASVADLCSLTGIHRRTAWVMTRLMRERGLLHRMEWAPPLSGRGDLAPVYRLGLGRDAPRPAPKSNAQSIRERNERAKALRAQMRIIRALSANTERFEVAA